MALGYKLKNDVFWQIIELKVSSGHHLVQGIQPKNKNISKAQVFVILLLASMSRVENVSKHA